MERLFYIKFYDSEGRIRVRKDYSGLQFSDQMTAEKYIQSEKKLMESVLDCTLKLNPHHREIPDFTIKELISAYCDATGVSEEELLGKSRKRDVFNIRLFITKSALNLGFVHGQLRPFFPDGVTYYYEKTFNNLMESGGLSQKMWQEYEQKAMTLLGVAYQET